jgi:hypothetical protein
VYQRHDFLAERKEALKIWGAHVVKITRGNSKVAIVRRVA